MNNFFMRAIIIIANKRFIGLGGLNRWGLFLFTYLPKMDNTKVGIT